MRAVERLAHQGARRGQRTLATLADDFRDRRAEIGVSQIEVARAAGLSRSSYQRIEHATMRSLSIVSASRVGSVLGLDLSVRTYPGANAIKGAAHAARLGRVLVHVATPLAWATEVPLPQVSERPFEQRAWDAVVRGVGRRTGFEMEMRVRDPQALERRLELKRRDDPIDALVVLLADTKHNREIVRANPYWFPGLARLTFRELTRLLSKGQHPPSALVLVPG